MTRRTIVTLYLPLDTIAVGRVMRAVVIGWPDATVEGSGGEMRVIADDDLPLSARRRIARERLSRTEVGQ